MKVQKCNEFNKWVHFFNTPPQRKAKMRTKCPKLCKCGKKTITGKCKSCSNKERAGKYKVNRPKGIIYNWKNKMFKEKNPMWKGNNVGNNALHEWVRRNKPKIEICEQCNKNKSFDIANISGKYLRDVNDYKWMCRSCHMKLDYFMGVRK